MQPINRKLYTAVVLLFCFWDVTVFSDPGQYSLGGGCSNENVTNLLNFKKKLYSTFAEIKSKISNGIHFVTTGDTNTEPVYAMLQCRDYMSTADCSACFENAVVGIRNCSAFIGGRVVYDGCFLRYETTSEFYTESITTAVNGSYPVCKNQTTSLASAFNATVAELAGDLRLATPKKSGFFAASKRKVVGDPNANVYGIAQCVHTINSRGCQECLDVASRNIQKCPPNRDGRTVDSGCFMRYSDTPFFDSDPGSKIALIAGLTGGGGVIILLLAAYFTWHKRLENQKSARGGDILLAANELGGPTKYSYGDLKAATRNFHEENKLGSGGFADVYKGTLNNGKLVAVKRLSLRQSERAKADFESEVKLIGNVVHRNLVRLLGYCSEGPELILVYEYMANTSLDRYLFGVKRGSLNWRRRYNIILGSAQALAYLHEQYQVRIIHRDIKPSNVLLDDIFQPKIADFGLARLLPDSQSHLTTRFAGTLGYTAPEYAIHGQLSEKVDTYSYGIVILEIISGIRCTELLNDPGADYLLKRAWKLYENDEHLELVDQTLDPNEYEAVEVKKIIELALMCTQSSPNLRPTMTEVVTLLRNTGSLENRLPTRPPFIDSEQQILPHNSTSTASFTSNATVSITEQEGR